MYEQRGGCNAHKTRVTPALSTLRAHRRDQNERVGAGCEKITA